MPKREILLFYTITFPTTTTFSLPLSPPLPLSAYRGYIVTQQFVLFRLPVSSRTSLPPVSPPSPFPPFRSWRFCGARRVVNMLSISARQKKPDKKLTLSRFNDDTAGAGVPHQDHAAGAHAPCGREAQAGRLPQRVRLCESRPTPKKQRTKKSVKVCLSCLPPPWWQPRA